jgi:serine/threonine protein kinase
MPYRPGDVVDNKYEIVERLGAGGMGELYKANHTWLGATRVIKVVHPQISGSEDARNRFLREARAATKVQHPGRCRRARRCASPFRHCTASTPFIARGLFTATSVPRI